MRFLSSIGRGLEEEWEQEGQMRALILAPLALPREAEVLGQQVGTPRVCVGAPCLGLW